VKWILRYIKSTSRVCSCFGSGELVLNGYTNADMTGDVDYRKYISGYMMTIQTTKMCYLLQRQNLSEVAKEHLWMQKFPQELGLS